MRLRVSLLVAVLALAGCRHIAAPVQPVGDWRILVEPVEPFAAVYRLACCGRRGMVAAVRGDASSLLVVISAPPAGEVVQAWVVDGRVDIFWPRDRCRTQIPGGFLPLGNGATLAFEPAVLALALSGRLPGDAQPVMGLAGWIAGSVGGVLIKARLAGDPARLVRLEIRGKGDRPAATIDCADHSARVPGTLVVASGTEHVELRLASWRGGSPPATPAWLDQPVCVGRT